MQLVAYGAQDIYLTGNPQITFFKVVYRRHTNFAMESIEQTLDGTVGFGNSVSSVISRNGDLVGRMYVEASVNLGGAANIWANPGSALLSEIICEIGGQEIDKHYGHWLEVWAELTEPNPNGVVSYVRDLVGIHPDGTVFQNMSAMGGVGGEDRGSCSLIEKMFIPLQFWFNRNPGLAIPLIALQYHEVKIKITFGTAAEVSAAASPTLTASLWADYIYLDTDERRRFAQVSHEYLIEQLQFINSENSNSHDLTFNHPVKELIWTGGITSSPSAKNNGASTPVALADSNYKIVLNGHDRFDERDVKYFTRTQVWQHHSGYGSLDMGEVFHTDDSIAVYSFALKPEEHQPSGTCNFSRIDNAQLVLSGSDALYIYATNYNVLRVMSGMGGLAYSN